jgi:uncharacterized protein YndB with AHSA1/START domain
MSGTTQETEVRIERSISAPPERVYRAWLDPELISRWMAPGDLRVSDVQVEERVGGRYRVSQADADGERGGFDCELAELVPNERIAFRWGFFGPEGIEQYDSLLTVSFREAPGGTTSLLLVHERLEQLRSTMPDVADKVGLGWGLALDKLSAALADRPV